ncbi:alpha-N-acetylgalactosaminide alpha-2,6-sialyltransferase 2 isoform X2 [Genypterus blacodes]|uniref:alpha-N-acetylgalactosaminide alpha-2,6-sialyltransferase 2 isoform X2 n=1 Tax=Genypterus blacodes TaxID=154954 RepID=UPI003F776862
MRASSLKCVFFLMGTSCLTLCVVIYGKYFTLNGFLSQQIDGGSRWVQDNIRDIWNITMATAEETIEGPCSLRGTIRKERLLRRLFNFSVPVLQWAGSFSEPAWNHLRSQEPPYGWKGLPLSVVRSTLALLNGAASSRLFDRRSPGQCVRCAVVGNGGILKGSRQGKDIDSHDFVFRVNGALTKGFEEDVGTKISFYGFTTNTMKHALLLYKKDGFTQIPQAADIRYIFIPTGLRDYAMLAAAVRGQRVKTGLDAGDRPWRYFGHKPAKNFKILHPEFIAYVTKSFLQSPMLRYKGTQSLYMPSTGALMLMAALHSCDQVSAYGFITSNYADFSDHYYDSVWMPLRFFANHDMRMESQLWQALDHWKTMKLYQRKGSS